MAWKYNWNRNSPPDTGESASLGATRIRQFKEALFERLTGWVNSFAADDSETDYGLKHAPFAVQESAPAAVANKILVYGKDVAGKCELFVRDEDGDEIQITSGGAINVTATGTIKMFGGAIAPTGYLMCDGSAVSRTTYSALFAIIGTTFGAGDTTTTFNLPDMRDRFPVGAGSTYARAATGGAATVTLDETMIPAHTHTAEKPASPNASFVAQGGGNNATVGGQAETTGSTGGGLAHNNLPPYIGIFFIIKT